MCNLNYSGGLGVGPEFAICLRGGGRFCLSLERGASKFCWQNQKASTPVMFSEWSLMNTSKQLQVLEYVLCCYQF